MRYFRLWAAWKRWDEEWHILGAEFSRTIRSFTNMAAIWTRVAKTEAAAVAVAQKALEDRRAECRNPRDILAGRDAQAKGTRGARRIRRYRNQIKSKVQSPTRPGLYTRGNQYSRTGLVRPGRMRAGLESLVGRREGS